MKAINLRTMLAAVFGGVLLVSALQASAQDNNPAAEDETLFGVIRKRDPRDAFTVDRSGYGKMEDPLEELPRSFRDPEGKEFAAGERRIPVNAYGAQKSIDSTFRGMTSAFFNANIKSPLAVTNITWGLTEPAVASGMQAALLQSMLLNQTRMAAEQNFLKQLELNPEIRGPVADAYTWCLHEGKVGEVGTEAIAKCMKDAGYDNAGFKFSDNGLVTVSDGETKIINEGRTIFLSYYLFMPEAVTGSANTSGGALTVSSLETNFRKYIGDIKFTLSSVGEDLNQDYVSVQKIAPEVSASEYLRSDRIPKVYKELLATIQGRCQFADGTLGVSRGDTTTTKLVLSGAAGGAQQTLLNASANEDYWTNKNMLSDARLLNLSSSTFAFSPAFGNDLFKIFRAGNQRSCGDLDSNAGSAFALEEPWDPAKPGREQFHRDLYVTAFRIARSQVLDSLIKMEEFINNLTIGSFDTAFVRNNALRLLYESAGSSDLRGLRAENDIKFANFRNTISSQAILASSGGVQLTGETRDAGAGRMSGFGG